MSEVYARLLQRASLPLARWYGLTTDRVDRVLDAQGPSIIRARVDGAALGVAAVGRALDATRNATGYVAHMDELVARAAGAGGRLVVLPEHNGLDLLFAGKPPKEDVEHAIDVADAPSHRAQRDRDLLHTLAPALQAFALYLFSRLAVRHDCYVFSGTFPEWDEFEQRLYSAGWLFAPDGTVLLRQRKLQPDARERAYGIEAGRDIPVALVEDLPTACLIGADAEAFEAFEIARARGALLYLLPAALHRGDHKPTAMRCGWAQTLSAGGVGIRSVLLGGARGASFSGYAALWGIQREDGILAQAVPQHGDHIVCAYVDRAGIEVSREADAYRGDRNEAFERNFAQWYPEG